MSNMQNSRLEEQVKKVQNNRRKTNRWHRIVAAMASVVVFCTTYGLILDALTQETTPYCGYEEHSHNESCYAEERTLTCALAEGGHVHTEACYELRTVLACSQPEGEEHSHSADCYTAESVLVCGQTETAPHEHTDACYTVTRKLICEAQEHTHTQQCYATPNADADGAATGVAVPGQIEGAPAGETPTGETPAGETPTGETPAGETPTGETPAGETPAKETPAGETPAKETPVGEAFHESQYVNGVTVTVSADAGVFLPGSHLSVTEVNENEKTAIGAAVEENHAENENVVCSYVFDIKVLDMFGNELQPADDRAVKVSFSHGLLADENLNVNIYHIDNDLTAERLDAQVESGEASAWTDGFSYYAVEFTYNGLSYATTAAEEIKVSDIVAAVGLTGTVDNVSAYHKYGVFSAEKRDGEWYILTKSEAVGPFSVHTPYPDPDDLFDEDACYFPNDFDVEITIDGVVYIVKLQYIARPIQENDPRAIEGVTGGDNLATFASGMPLSTIFIDNSHFERPTSYQKLTSEPGFSQAAGTVFAKAGGFTWSVYDPNVPGATQLEPGKENEFLGPLFAYTFSNAAILSDGRVADVRITYSDAYITIDDRATPTNGGFHYQICLAHGKQVSVMVNDYRRGSDADGLYNRYTAAVRMTATIQIVDKTGTPINGSYISCCEGINVSRAGTAVNKPLYNGPDYDFWSEAIRVKGGTVADLYVRPNNDQEEPASATTSTAAYQRKWYYPYVTKDHNGIKFTGVRWTVPNSAPKSVYTDPSIVQGSNGMYSAGFVTTADAKSGIQLEVFSAGAGPAYNATETAISNALGYDTFFMSGYSIWHRINSSSTAGGTIQTTTTGNPSGSLSLSDGGSLLSPGMYVVPDGKTVVYTMTPETGFELDSVSVNPGTLNHSGGGDVTPSVETVTDGDGNILYYTYEFSDNRTDNAIHVKWKRATSESLTLKKTAIGGDGTFTFHVSVEGTHKKKRAYKSVASWQTSWLPDYSYSYLTSVAYPLTLDGVPHSGDILTMNFLDDTSKLLLHGNCDENGTVTGISETSMYSENLTLYKAYDASNDPYTIEIDGKTYELYSDTMGWNVSGTSGSNAANFWVYDPDDELEHYYDIFVLSEVSESRLVDLSASPYNGTHVSGNVYAFNIRTIGGEGSVTLPDLPYGYHYTVEEQPLIGWGQIAAINTDGDLTADKTAEYKNQTVQLTVQKDVLGPSPGSEPFDFQLTLYAPSGKAIGVLEATLTSQHISYTLNTAAGPGDQDSLTVLFSLRDGETYTLPHLPVGTSFVLTEPDHNGYSVQIKQRDGAGEFPVSSSASGDTTSTVTLSDDGFLVVYNNPGIALPETGGIGTNIHILGGSFLMMTVLFMGFRIRRRKEKGGKA